MNRCIKGRKGAEHASPTAGMVDGGIAPVVRREAGRQVVPAEVIIAHADVRLEYDRAAGWPPKLVGHTGEECLTPARTEVSFGLDTQREYRRAALKHPEVASRLGGRWETLGVHLCSHRDTPCHVEIRARVCFFNYTSNRLIEAYVEDGAVVSVRVGEPHEHPEAPVEMAQAIALARAYPQIGDRVAGLDAHAILRVPMDPSAPSYRHRCLLVMFTEHDNPHRELPMLFSALVDLCEQRVLAFGSSSCGSDVGEQHDSRATKQGGRHGGA